ncbi:polyamine aminopropyltransferase [Desulfotomaculum defluvii]
MLDFWFTEHHTDSYKVSWRVEKILHTEKSSFQEIAVIESPELGRALLLDNIVQTTTKFEFIYHEMITHIPLMIHPEPKSVLIIGGGDGGTVREILKHPSVETIDLIEIDERVIEVSKRWLPEISHALGSEKVNIRIVDGLKYTKQCDASYDIIIVDCTDPSGPSMNLFAKEFYKDIYKALKSDGVFVSQTGSPSFSSHYRLAVKNIMEVFPLARPYLTCEPTYIAGFWSFTVGSKKYQLDNINPHRMLNIKTNYYTPAVHKAAFVLPKYIEKITE